MVKLKYPDSLIGNALLETYLDILWRRRMRADDAEAARKKEEKQDDRGNKEGE